MNDFDLGALGPEELLREGSRLRQLARRLVADDHLIEDLVQEGFLKAVERGFRDRTHLRRWLWVTLRNAIFESRRGQGPRMDRERATARPEKTPSTAEVVTELEGMELVARALRELPEPYRTTLKELFVDGLTVREIAQRDGVLANSIHKRQQRAIELLRAELDQKCGGRDGWRALVCAFAHSGRASLPAPVLASSGLPIVWTAIPIALLVWAGLVAWDSLRPLPPEPLAAGEWSTVSARDRSSGRSATSAARTQREVTPPARNVDVRIVLAESEEPVPGARVHWWPLPAEDPERAADAIDERIASWFRLGVLEASTRAGSTEYEADERGRLQLPRGPRGFLAIASAAGRFGYALASERDTLTVELHADFDVDVRVLTPDGEPIEGALVALAATGYYGRDFVSAPTDAGGRSRLRHAGYARGARPSPAAGAARLEARVVGRTEGYHVEWSELATRSHDLPFAWPVGYADVAVVDAATGAPVPGLTSAPIAGGRALGAEGRATIAMACFNPPSVTAVDWRHRWPVLESKEGARRDVIPVLRFDESRLELLDGDAEARPTRPGERLRFVFGTKSASEGALAVIRGRLVDATGQALAGRRLELRNGDDQPLGGGVVTDPEGRFVFRIRYDRTQPSDVGLALLDARSSSMVECVASLTCVPEGSTDLGDVVVRARRVVGRVFSPGREPLADACVRLIDEPSEDFRKGCLWSTGLEVRTDEHGHFEFLVDCSAPSPLPAILIASHANFATHVRRLAIPSAGLEVVLEPARALRGRVLMHASLEHTSIFVEASELETDLGLGDRTDWYPTPTHSLVQVPVAANGEFELAGLGSGPYSLRVLHYEAAAFESGAGATLFATRIRPGDEASARELEQLDLRSRFHRTRVELVGPDEERLPDVIVRVRGDGSFASETTTDARGVAVVLVPTGARLSVESRAYFDRELDATSVHVRAVLKPRSRLNLALIGGLPELPADCELFALVSAPDGSGAKHRGLDSDGRVTLPAPNPAVCRVELQLRKGSNREPCGEQTLTLQPGRTDYELDPIDSAVLEIAIAALDE